MIKGVVVKQLTTVQDKNGFFTCQMLNAKEAEFKGFGELYFSLVYPDIIKGWHLHQQMILNYLVILGKIKLVLFDTRLDSETKGEIMDLYLEETRPTLVQVPNLVWTGFKGNSTPYSIVANCSSIPHFENEINRLDPFSPQIPYDWNQS